jgi:hypothetical protein
MEMSTRYRKFAEELRSRAVDVCWLLLTFVLAIVLTRGAPPAPRVANFLFTFRDGGARRWRSRPPLS